MNYLRWEDFISINRLTIDKHGGQFIPPENLLNPDRLLYASEIVKETVFGQRLHTTVPEIAAAYFFYITTGHVFQDGNKRVGLEAALLFLGLNGYRIQDKMIRVSFEREMIPKSSSTGNQILFQLTIELAAGELNLEQLKSWFAENAVPRTR